MTNKQRPRRVPQKDTPLVLLDYMTPGMDGLTVLKEIIKRFPNTYVIIITGKGSEAIAVEMMKAGASDYILKPFTNLDLAERIDNVLKIRELELSNRDLLKEQERLLEEAAAWNCELEKRIVATREIPDCRKESINELLQKVDSFKAKNKAQYENKTVLIVDDEKIMLDLTSIILKNRNYKAFTASDGTEALEVISQENPAIVLLDYFMPGMDGLTVLREIKERFIDTYVIMFTGKGSEEIAVEVMKAGASDYILKPFNNQDLAERIDNVLKIRALELSNRDLLKERKLLMEEIVSWNLELEKLVEEISRK